MGYAIAFLLLLVVAVLALPKKKNAKASIHQSDSKNFSRPPRKAAGIELYKKKEIRSFRIVGTYYRKNVGLEDSGEFQGYAVSEQNRHDKYAVAIYKQSGKQLGYIPKQNKKLSDSIDEWHNGKVFCWGALHYGWEMGHHGWHGWVKIPVGLEDDKIEEIKNILEYQDQLDHLLQKGDSSIEECFEALEINTLLVRSIEFIGIPNSFPNVFPKWVIPFLSTKLAKEKNWEKLIELKKYEYLIDQLTERIAESVRKRIEKAEQEITKK